MNACRLARIEDAAAIQAIYAPIVRETAISFEYEPPDLAEMERRLSKVLARRPWLVCRAGHRVLGYAYATTYRERQAYDWNVEVSVYVHADARGRGVARELYGQLFQVLRALNYRQAVAGATLPNPASERLHASFGFQRMGVLPRAGYKFDAWHDVIFWYLPLEHSAQAAREIINVNDLVKQSEWQWLTSE
jgi:L-amino acid N-acyltransferase YncA